MPMILKEFIPVLKKDGIYRNLYKIKTATGLSESLIEEYSNLIERKKENKEYLPF